MKYLGLLLSMLSFAVFAQETTTNAEESNYAFEKIVHLDATPVLSQGNSGTCWSFSGMSFFESELLRMGKDETILSEMYIVRKAYEKKAEMYVRLDGKTNFGQGGEFHDIPAVIKEFGVVTQEAYDGLNYGSGKHNHSEMYKVLKGAMDGVIQQMNSRGFNGLTSAWKQAISGILDAYLGQDITSFEYNGTEYTPKSFADYLGLDMDNYVSITSFTHQEMNEPFQLAIPDNWSRQDAYNVALDEMFDATVTALENGYTVGWTADVSEDGFSHRKGLAINPSDTDLLEATKDNAFMNPTDEVSVTAELRQEGYENKTTQDDHLMHIVGLYKDQNGTKYFLVKNSWGSTNHPEGFLYVSESYFKMKTIYVYMHKDSLSKGMTKQLGL
ncbi:C1 family peptidase [Crocinitomicaceae bacterium]|nr:C1 family peptidase [Crocinitomicaceae bacterium]MDB3906132.1 C1 family peptidase [Crocinitomicaceae bacterium]